MKRLALCFAALLAAVSIAGGAAADEANNTIHVKVLAQRDAARGDKAAQAYLEALAGTASPERTLEGLAWLTAAAQRGLPEAQTQAALALQALAAKQPEGADESLRAAASLLRKAAEQNYAQGQIELAKAYAKGQGVAQDHAKAMEWGHKAAQGGDIEAMGWIGAAYLTGTIVTKDVGRALIWLERAAVRGNPASRVLLSLAYQGIEGVPANPERARYWRDHLGTAPEVKSEEELLAAAKRGDTQAMTQLGSNKMNGRGMPKDEKQGIFWLGKAAGKGDPVAQVNLGVSYLNGNGVPKDDAEAVKWFRRAADQGHRSGQVRLGMMYETGRGVGADKAIAIDLYRKAAAQGDLRAAERLKKLEK
jgi:TPR repeat protein